MSDTLSEKEKYDLALEHVQREDALVNARTTWFLALQGFLFAAFFQAVALGTGDKLQAFNTPRRFISLCVLVVTSVGVLAAGAWATTVLLALRQIQDVKDWLAGERLPTDRFPPLRRHSVPLVVVSSAILVAAWLTLGAEATSYLKSDAEFSQLQNNNVPSLGAPPPEKRDTSR